MMITCLLLQTGHNDWPMFFHPCRRACHHQGFAQHIHYQARQAVTFAACKRSQRVEHTLWIWQWALCIQSLRIWQP